MQNKLYTPILPYLFVILLLAGTGSIEKKQRKAIVTQPISMCGTSTATNIILNNGKYIPLMPGVRNHHYPVKTLSDSAQVYFDQGLSFYYGYHFSEALASFKEAARFDKDCTMAYWGQALALGPYYNVYNYKMPKEIAGVLRKMQLSNTGTNNKENDLCRVMSERYSSDTTNADRDELDKQYAASLRLLVKKYPQDNHLKTLYIDAVMLCHKWDFWLPDKSARPWTPELVTLCEAILKDEPRNTAIIHYYIHLTEASRQPQKALPYADRLTSDMPGVAHMVHMSTHSYQRNGLYTKGIAVNEEAYRVFSREDSVTKLKLSKGSTIHFFAVQSYCAINAGMYKQGMPIYNRAKEKLALLNINYETDPYAQFVHSIPTMVHVRFGKWQEILNAARPDSNWAYAQIMDNFARGIACIRTNKLQLAKQHLASLQHHLADSILIGRRMPFNSPHQSAQIAADILTAEVLYAQGRTGAAIKMLQQAVEHEDELVYREPPEWLIPARQYLGYYLLKLNKVAEAEKIYRQDLTENPGNGWALTGLYNCMKVQGKHKEMATCKARLQKVFAKADVKPANSIY